MRQSSFLEKKQKATNQSTIAQLNQVSIKDGKNMYNSNLPFRIKLPEYFNIPSFKDDLLHFQAYKQNKVTFSLKEDGVFRKRMKDLEVLAEGMKRAKNIKEESRYYFTMGVLLHNVEQYVKSVDMFQKFLKIVLYLQDHKSLELVLNAMGCSYMMIQDFQKAIQCHQRQGEVSSRADVFLSLVNMGMCQQMLANYQQSHRLYQKAEDVLITMEMNNDRQQREQVLYQLQERVEYRIQECNVFLTSKSNSKSPAKSMQNNILKQESILELKKAGNRRQFEQHKLKYAIHAAEQSIEDYLKSSIVL